MTTPGSAPPQISPDGHWWWDGSEWTPASDAARAQAATQAAEVLQQAQVHEHPVQTQAVPEQSVPVAAQPVQVAEQPVHVAAQPGHGAELPVQAQPAPESLPQPQPVPAALFPSAPLTGPVGAKGSVTRSAAHLGRPVLAATQVESRGGVGQSMLLQSGTGLVGLLFRKAIAQKHRALEAQMPGQQVPVPRHALVALTADALHVIPASDLGRPSKGAQTFSVPLSDVLAVRVAEQRMVTRFDIDLRNGQTLIGETKRIGANRHNTPALRLIGARAAVARAVEAVPQPQAVAEPAPQVVSYGSILPAQVPSGGGSGRGRLLTGLAAVLAVGVAAGAFVFVGGGDKPAPGAAQPSPTVSPTPQLTFEQRALRSLVEAASMEEYHFTDANRYTTRMSDLVADGYVPMPGATVTIVSATASRYCLKVTLKSVGKVAYYDSAHGGLNGRRCT